MWSHSPPFPPPFSYLLSLSLITPPHQLGPLTRQVLTSPDGQWTAEASFEFLDGDAAFQVKLVIERSDGSVHWIPVNYTQGEIGYIYPALRSWSLDSRTFYYFNMQDPDGCGDFYPVESEWVALNLDDGSLSIVPVPSGRGHTVSPDGQTMIYTNTTAPYGLVFRQFFTSTEVFLPLPASSDEALEVKAGGAVWSPNASSFAVSAAYGDSCGDGPLSFSVLRVDNLSDPTIRPLIEGSPKLLRILQWDSDRILVRDGTNTVGGSIQEPEYL
jgi:hypothetical protein